MRKVAAAHDALSDAAILLRKVGVAIIHLRLGIEGLDDSQTTESLLKDAEKLAQLSLSLTTLAFEVLTYATDDCAGKRKHDESEEGELRAHDNHRDEIYDDEDGVLEEHVNGGHDRPLDLADIASGSLHDVSLTLFLKEADREADNLGVDLLTDVADDIITKTYAGVGGEICRGALEDSAENHEETRIEESVACTVIELYEGDVIIEIIDNHLIIHSPREERRNLTLLLEDNLEDRDHQRHAEH